MCSFMLCSWGCRRVPGLCCGPLASGWGGHLAAAPLLGSPFCNGTAARWGWGAPHTGCCMAVTVAASKGLLSASCFLQGRCSVHLGSALYFLANAGFVILKKNGATPMSD